MEYLTGFVINEYWGNKIIIACKINLRKALFQNTHGVFEVAKWVVEKNTHLVKAYWSVAEKKTGEDQNVV